ncbi:MAG: nucleotidyltransferase [Devosia sp.]|nr:nucleotidyltransferase [Devosia sp.]
MKLVTQFDEFLQNTVNLNATRVSLLEDSVETLKSVIRNSEWKPRVAGFSVQGSWAHKTIIRPVAGAAFDADLVVFVHPVEGWEPKDYVNELNATLREVAAYADKTRRYSHCVTVEYAGERKIDIAPCLVDRVSRNSFEVCNRDANRYEMSNPDAYTSWLVDRNRWSGANSFRKVTRLVKYLRDIKTTFTCPSVLLTTVLAERMGQADQGNGEFADVPSALRTLFQRLDDWLQPRILKPRVGNPVLQQEVLSDLLTDDQYKNFRNKISTYRGWIDDAYAEPDRAASIVKWRRVFGDEFAKAVAVDEARRVAVAVAAADGPGGIVSDLVEKVRALGRAALPAVFGQFNYMKQPAWRRELQGDLGVLLAATLHGGKGKLVIRDVSPLSVLPKEFWLKFRVQTTVGLPLSGDYAVQWRVRAVQRSLQSGV